MIQAGAEKIFRSQNATITDEDIDVLLEKGEAKTAADATKLERLADVDSLQRFTFDTEPEKKLMEFGGHDFRQVAAAAAPIVWIEPPKRDRKVGFRESCNCVFSISLF